VSGLGSWLGFGSKTVSTTEQQLLGIQGMTSVYGKPVPIVHGRSRIAANVIYYNDFTAIPHTSSTAVGGKGGKTTVSQTDYTYTAAVALGLCEGPVISFQQMWSDKDKYAADGWSNWSTFLGAYGQSAWTYLTSNHPSDADPYSGLAYVAIGAYDLGASGAMKNQSVEVQGPYGFNVGGGIYDAVPSDSLTDYLTNATHGAGFPSSKLASWTDFYNYAAALGIFIGPAWDTQRAAREDLTEVIGACNCEFVWSEGLLKVIPYADKDVTGNGHTYVANTTPEYDLTDDDFLPNSGRSSMTPSSGEAVDPIQITRKTQADAYNCMQIEFLDRTQDYNPAIAEWKDQANIDAFGLRQPSGGPVRAHFIHDMAIARNVIQLIGTRQLYVRNVYEFNLSLRFGLLEPMDLVNIVLVDSGAWGTSPFGQQAWGGFYSKVTVRLTEVTETEQGALAMVAEEWPFGVANATQYGHSTGGGYVPDTQVDPGNANVPVFFEPPLQLSDSGQPELWVLASGGALWGGAYVWVSTDNATYQRVGSILAGCRYGSLTATLANHADPDTTNTLAVNISTSGGILLTATATDYNALATLCVVGSGSGTEIVAYETATLTSAGHYDLTTLRRALYGTPAASHSSGADFARLDQTPFKYVLPPGLAGQTIYVKLQSFNSWGGGLQDLSGLTPSTHVVLGANPYASPTSVTLTITNI